MSETIKFNVDDDDGKVTFTGLKYVLTIKEKGFYVSSSDSLPVQIVEPNEIARYLNIIADDLMSSISISVSGKEALKIEPNGSMTINAKNYDAAGLNFGERNILGELFYLKMRIALKERKFI